MMAHLVAGMLLLGAQGPDPPESSRGKGMAGPEPPASFARSDDGGTPAELANRKRHANRPSPRASIETVIERRMSELIEERRARRISVRRGLLNIGAYEPMAVDGVKAPPLHLFSRAGGQSLNYDPTTGRNYFWP